MRGHYEEVLVRMHRWAFGTNGLEQPYGLPDARGAHHVRLWQRY